MKGVIRAVDLADPQDLEALWLLQHASYRIEAGMIGYDKAPPLMETLDMLGSCKELFYGMFDDGELLGAVSYTLAGDRMTICRMMVDSRHFRQGIASRLLAYVLLKRETAQSVQVATSVANLPAIRLYEKFGFVENGETEVAPDVWIASFVKTSFIMAEGEEL